MRAAGGTAFLDGLSESTKLLEGVEGRRTVILITDGYDENSTTTIDQVLASAQAAHVTVYVVGIGGVAGISLKGEVMLRRIADETGGRVFFPPRELGPHQHRRRRERRRPQPVSHHLHAGESEQGRQVAAGRRRRARRLSGPHARRLLSRLDPRPFARRWNSG